MDQVILETVLVLASWRDKDPDTGFLDHGTQMDNLRLLLALVLKHVGLSLQVQSCAMMWQCICRAEWLDSDDCAADVSCVDWPVGRLNTLEASAMWHGLGHLKSISAAPELRLRLAKALATMDDLCAHAAAHLPYKLEEENTYKTVNMTFRDCRNTLSDICELLDVQPPFVTVIIEDPSNQ